jgi:hypothetical protein
MWLGAYRADSKHYLSTLCPWKLEDFEYDGLCIHSPLIDLTRLSDHFQEAVKLTPKELAEKAAKRRASAELEAEQKGIRDEDTAIMAMERTKLKALADQKKAQRAAEKALAPPSDMEREQLAILPLKALEASELRASEFRAPPMQAPRDELTAFFAAALASIESGIREDLQPRKRKLEQTTVPTSQELGRTKQQKLSQTPVLQQSPEVLVSLRATALNKVVGKKLEQMPVTTPEDFERMKQAKRPPAKPRWETKKLQRMAVTTPEELERMKQAKLEASRLRK